MLISHQPDELALCFFHIAKVSAKRSLSTFCRLLCPRSGRIRRNLVRKDTLPQTDQTQLKVDELDAKAVEIRF
jgi:hypothetical protein